MVATPIGNLSDISERGRETLASVDGIFCEDTRVAAKLCSALGISPAPQFYRCDANLTEGELDSYADLILREMENNLSYALISDAGTPGISDPGAKLLRRLQVVLPVGRVFGIPGASAVPTLLSVSGFEGNSFGFFGFFPRSENEGRALIAAVRGFVSERGSLV